MKTEAEAAVKQLQAKELSGLPASTRSWKKQVRILPRAFRANAAPPTT